MYGRLALREWNNLSVMRNASMAPKVIRLAPWSFDEGATCSDYVASDFDYYRKQIRDGRMQDAIAGTGRTLERFLSMMRLNLHLAIPARPGEHYTIGDLYDPFFAWLQKHPIERQDMSDFPERLATLNTELDDYWRLRNWSGAHHNNWASTISATEARNFIDIVADIVRLLECPSCKELVVYNEGASLLHCPRCKPSPQPRVLWEYRSDWLNQALRLAQQDAKMQKNAILMTRKAFTRFLRDMRRRLGLAILPPSNDVYEIVHLYRPFIAWVENHPRNDQSDWVNIGRYRSVIDQHIQGEDWSLFSPTAQSSPAFIDAIKGMIHLFECVACGQLLNYDEQSGLYLCLQCGKQELNSTQSAYWYIVKQG